jgi:hypothetical protein
MTKPTNDILTANEVSDGHSFTREELLLIELIMNSFSQTDYFIDCYAGQETFAKEYDQLEAKIEYYKNQS